MLHKKGKKDQLLRQPGRTSRLLLPLGLQFRHGTVDFFAFGGEIIMIIDRGLNNLDEHNEHIIVRGYSRWCPIVCEIRFLLVYRLCNQGILVFFSGLWICQTSCMGKPTNITIVSWFMDVYGSYTVTIVRRGYKPT